MNESSSRFSKGKKKKKRLQTHRKHRASHLFPYQYSAKGPSFHLYFVFKRFELIGLFFFLIKLGSLIVEIHGKRDNET